MTNNYVVPFHHSEMLNTFGKIREPDDMDAIILMNRDAYADQDDAAKAVINAAGRVASLDCNKVQLDVAAAGLQQFAAMPGKEVIALTPDQARAFDDLSAQVTMQIVAETGDGAQEIVDALKVR